MVFLSPRASSLVSVVLLASVFLSVNILFFFFFFPHSLPSSSRRFLRITIEPELVSHVNNTRLLHSYRRALLRWLLRSPAPS